VLRGSQDWRPLRGPLKAAGVRQIIVFVRQMYADWHASGYLLVNPAHKLSHHRVQTPEQRAQAKQDALAAAAARSTPRRERLFEIIGLSPACGWCVTDC